ncbi:putative E3 ubiquitin-protein ligase UBR7, partial [Blattella germanica]
NKEAVNDQNHYNQNFRGLYCTCRRPYPDPDDQTDDEMIQCVVCEDWYHGRHLGSTIPALHDYEEMVCGTCIDKHPFLSQYQGSPAKSESVSDEASIKVEVVDVCNGTMNSTDLKTEVLQENSRVCVLKEIKPEKKEHGAVFFFEGWRKKLCRCDSCQNMYESHEVSFLMDELDTVQAYEEQGKANGEGGQPSSRYEQGLKALICFPEYNNMKIQLKEYLQKFAENKKIVREEDIREFFSGMEARKKQRVDVQPPYYCH